MLELINNSVNSEYIIINFKLDFNENDTLNYKDTYYIVICEWIKIILDKYKNIFNWTFYINNLNYQVIRVFILIDKYNYPNMDNQKIIYITNAFEFYNKNDINIIDLSKQFNIEDLKILLLQEINNINNNLDSNESNSSSDGSLITMPIEVFGNYFENKDKNIEHKLIKEQSNNYKINSIGLSGVNKNTFIYELKKINVLKHTNIYYNKNHNIFKNQIYKKIKENNKFYWILYDDYLNEIYNNSEYRSAYLDIIDEYNINYKLNTILSIIDNKNINLKYKNNNKYIDKN